LGRRRPPRFFFMFFFLCFTISHWFGRVSHREMLTLFVPLFLAPITRTRALFNLSKTYPPLVEGDPLEFLATFTLRPRRVPPTTLAWLDRTPFFPFILLSPYPSFSKAVPLRCWRRGRGAFIVFLRTATSAGIEFSSPPKQLLS